MSSGSAQADRTRFLQRALLGLAAASGAGTAAELAMQRHWTSAEQLVPWGSVGLFAIGLTLLLVRPSRPSIWVARSVGAAVAGSAGYGVVAHVRANYAAGSLDFRYETRWGSMSLLDRLWTAFSDTVGPAPTFAPAVLAVAATCLCLATYRHPGQHAGAAVEPSEELATS